jgi:hypothetical protein
MKRLILTITLLAAVAGYSRAGEYIVFSFSGRVTVGGKTVNRQQHLDGQQTIAIANGAFVTLLDPTTRNLCTIGQATGTIVQLFNARKYAFRKIAQKYVDYILNGSQHPEPRRNNYRQTAGAVTRQPYWAADEQGQ